LASIIVESDICLGRGSNFAWLAFYVGTFHQ